MSNQVYSTGRRKESVARVWISNGTGNITINKKNIDDYFPDKALRMIINQPLEVAKKSDSVDLRITVLGGGLSGQAGAIKHGLSRALTKIDPNTKDVLKKIASLGLAGIYVKEKFGGSGLDRLSAALVFEELSRGCVSTAAYLSIHNMVAWMIDSEGSDELKKRFIFFKILKINT